MNALRNLGVILIAVLVGGVVIGAIQMIGMLLFPLPGNMNMSQFEAMSWEEKRDLLHAAPPIVFLPVIVGYLVGMIAAGAVATLLWPRRTWAAAWIIGVFFTLVNIINVAAVPQPLWVSIATFVMFVPGALVGGWLAKRYRSVAPLSTPDA